MQQGSQARRGGYKFGGLQKAGFRPIVVRVSSPPHELRIVVGGHGFGGLNGGLGMSTKHLLHLFSESIFVSIFRGHRVQNDLS